MPIAIVLQVIFRCFSLFLLGVALAFAISLYPSQFGNPMDFLAPGGFLFAAIILWFAAPFLSSATVGSLGEAIDLQGISLWKLTTALIAAFGLHFVLSKFYLLLSQFITVYIYPGALETADPKLIRSFHGAMSSSALGLIIGIIFLLQAGRIARWLTTRYERQQSPAVS